MSYAAIDRETDVDCENGKMPSNLRVIIMKWWLIMKQVDCKDGKIPFHHRVIMQITQATNTGDFFYKISTIFFFSGDGVKKES